MLREAGSYSTAKETGTDHKPDSGESGSGVQSKKKGKMWFGRQIQGSVENWVPAVIRLARRALALARRRQERMGEKRYSHKESAAHRTRAYQRRKKKVRLATAISDETRGRARRQLKGSTPKSGW